jgi:PAS domain S-box-containing protein/putative nucleotidyltransferase with HDIG domain
MAGVKKPEDREGSSNQLRAEAEKKVARSADKSALLKKQDLDKLVHELQVHQVELEMQNEELRSAQEQIAKSRNDYADLYDFAPVGYLTFNGDALITGVNLTGAALLGVERQKLLKRRFRQFVAPADAERWDRHFVSVLQQGEKQSCDLLLRRKDGSTFHARLDSIRMEMDDGICIVRTAMSDITAEKQAEEALQESEEQFRTSLENAPDGVYINDLEGNFLYGNRRCEEIIGYKREELIGKNFLELNILPEDSLARAAELLQLNIEGKSTGPDELELISKDGRRVPVEINTNAVRRKGQAVVLAFVRDITQRKQADKALRSEHIMLARTEGIAHIGSWEWDIATDTVTWSDELFRIFQRDPQEGAPSFAKHPAFYHPDDMARLRQAVEAAVADGTPYELELRAIRKDGETRMCVARGVAEMAPGGRAVRLFGSLQDITERKQAEEALQESEEIFRNFMEYSPIQVFFKDENIRALRLSKNFEEMLGKPVTELLGKNMDELFPSELAKNMIADDKRIMKEGKEVTVEEELNGRFYSTTKFPIFIEGKPRYLAGFTVDITERKRAEDTQREAEETQRQEKDVLQAIIDNIPVMIASFDREGHFQWINRCWQSTLGWSFMEVLQTDVLAELYPDPEYRKYVADSIASSASTWGDFRTRTRDGRLLDTLWVNVPLTEGSNLGIGIDITERKIAEEKRRESEERFRLAVNATQDGIWEWDIQTNAEFFAPRWCEIIGYSFDDPELPHTYNSWASRIHPDDHDRVISAMNNHLEKGTKYDVDYRHRHKSGEYRWQNSRGQAVFDESGKPIKMVGCIADITERKLDEEKLKKSYESLKKTLNDAINTMVKIVEMRDPYTAGHQRKVADLAIAIAREMKLEDTRIDQLRMAAVTHDIGKMYIPSDILSKPGRLSDIEFDLVKTHSQHGYDIVKSMDFPCAVANAVLQHHERLDGSGYPNNLKGEDTLLEAKILAVADVIEAMASHRPYRPALGIDEALEEISKNRGRLYDPDVADTCLELFNSGRFEFKPVYVSVS